VIAERIDPIDVALLSAGAAQSPLITDAFLTLTSELAAEALRILGSPQTVPLHFEGWAHYTEGADALRRAFEQARLRTRLHVAERGERIDLCVDQNARRAQRGDMAHGRPPPAREGVRFSPMRQRLLPVCRVFL
jgi:L-ascorbate metabolism protein UlaG (beta-lactamase superfamily)